MRIDTRHTAAPGASGRGGLALRRAPGLITRLALTAMLAQAGLHQAAAAEQARPSDQGGQAPRPLAFGGVQAAGSSHYAYAGVISPRPGARLGQGWFTRAVASWLSYRYDATLPQGPVEVRARAPGLELGAGHAWQGDGWSAEASLAVGARHTRLSPSDPGSDVRGTRWALTPHVAGQHELGSGWRIEGLGSYALGPRDHFLRLRLSTTPAEGWRTGVEARQAGGREYRDRGLGAFVARDLGDGLSVELHLGSARHEDGQRDPYLGAAFSSAL